MSSAKRHSPVRSPEAPAPAATSFLDLFALALFVARWFVPAEGVELGVTLGLAQGWLLWGALAAWMASREGLTWHPRLSPWNVATLLLVGGHVLAALLVCLSVGQKRAALNGLWEWTSLGISAWWIASQLANRSFPRTVAIALVATGATLSAYGLWQRTVTHPGMAVLITEFDDLERRLPTLTGDEARTAARRLTELRKQVGAEYLSLDSNGRQAMRQRLIGSSEPIGLFALANTLAALLLAALFLAIGLLVDSPPKPRGSRVLMAVVCLLIAFVLLLTKSRTAWVGAAVGGCAFATYRFSGRLRAIFVSLGLSTAAIALLIAIAWSTGGLDRLVVTEAPKSLKYRTEYWRSTWSVIAGHPLFGVGAGNFRQHYLRYKLPQSSEEILDPHNLVLDAWVNGGLLALLGVLGLCAAVGVSSWRERRGIALADRPPVAESTARASMPPALNPWLVPSALLLAVAGLTAEAWLLNAGVDLTTLGLGVAAAVLARLISAIPFRSGGLPFAAVIAAWVGLSVHLLGAGGIGMPAISEIWLWLAALISAGLPTRKPTGWTQPVATYAPVSVAVACLALFVTQLLTTTIPVAHSRLLMQVAESVSLQEGNLRRAARDLSEASRIDPLNPEPHRRLAQVLFSEWTQSDDPAVFEEALAEQHQAAALDPFHSHDDRALGEMYLARFRQSQAPVDAALAVKSLEAAVEKYPNHARTHASLAYAGVAAADENLARSAAGKALDLDQLNRDLGHYDRLIPEAELPELRRIAGRSGA